MKHKLNMTILDFSALLEDSGSPVTNDDIREFEEYYSGVLPEDFKSFLRIANGGFPTIDIGIQEVYGISDCQFSIKDTTDDYNSEGYYRIPKGLVWIMHNGCGDGYCLSIRNDSHGHIYFWSHDGENIKEPSEIKPRLHQYQNIEFISKSFEQFIGSLILPGTKIKPNLP